MRHVPEPRFGAAPYDSQEQVPRNLQVPHSSLSCPLRQFRHIHPNLRQIQRACRRELTKVRRAGSEQMTIVRDEEDGAFIRGEGDG